MLSLDSARPADLHILISVKKDQKAGNRTYNHVLLQLNQRGHPPQTKTIQLHRTSSPQQSRRKTASRTPFGSSRHC